MKALQHRLAKLQFETKRNLTLIRIPSFKNEHQPQIKHRVVSSNKPRSLADTDSLSTRTSRSHASSRPSVKRREAEAEFRSAQIKARQARERADERIILNKIAEREAPRKLEVAAAKLQVRDTDYDVNEPQPIDSIITENRQETLHSDMISKDCQASHDNVQSSVHFKDPTLPPAVPGLPSLTPEAEVGTVLF